MFKCKYIEHIGKLVFPLILILVTVFTLFTSFTSFSLPARGAGEKHVRVIEVDGTITAGQKYFIERQVRIAVEEDAQLLVVVLNTPGGLVDATMEINSSFMNAPIPVAVLVAPTGAIAASAGAFIVISSDLAAMAPGTTIGAAHPVAVSPEGTETADEKTTIFLAKHLRGMAEEKGRPADIAERFVTENLTLNAREALEEGVIEYLASDVTELLEQLDGITVEKMGATYRLNTAGAVQKTGEMNTREKLQNWLSDPQIAFFLLMLGIMGIYFGFNAPGTFVPEVVGGILLVMGIYGIGLFDTNTTGILLLLLGIGLIVAEIFVAGFGVLGIGGAACLIFGAILLPMEPLMAPDWYETFRYTVIGTVLALTILTVVVVHLVIRSRKRTTGGSTYFNPPEKGVVVEKLAPEGMLKARGELWKARSADGTDVPEGTEVEVVRYENMVLWVRTRHD